MEGNDNLKGHFTIKNGTPARAFYPKFGVVDLKKLSLKQAEELVKAGFENLIPVKKKEA
jgi:hypothetical protein